MNDRTSAPTDTLDVDQVLRTIAEGTAGATGDDFFRALVQYLALALSCRAAFASEFASSGTRVSTLAFWDRDHFLDNFEYEVAHTPCEGVLQGDIGYYPSRVQQSFPLHAAELAELNAESYIAIPMVGRQGEVLGHLAAIDDKALTNRVRELSIFRIFGVRAAAELERRRVEQALRRSEQRLASVLSTTMDAIVTVDADHRITLFNRSAETVFRCSEAWAVGQPIERFLTGNTRAALLQFLRGETNLEVRHLWAPEGMSATRADGEEFPIEATVSSHHVDDARVFTIILRDVNDRESAYAGLRALRTRHENLQEELQRRESMDGMICEAPAMLHLQSVLQQVARTDTTVLITGETGTGKERVASALHRASPRSANALVPVNCAALPGELIESELFGHERGSFTGATSLRRGRFELAHQGTIFLDEVGELSLQAQAKLLRVLQEHEFERVGGSKPIRVDVRLIAATNRDLQQMVASGTFRADLYYRLNVFPVHVPALRERREEIEPLAQHFLQRIARKLGRDFSGFLPLSLERMRRYSWPGNIRELQNVVERAAILANGPRVEVRDPVLDAAPLPDEQPASAAADEVLRAHITRVLADCRGTIEGVHGAAAVLGLKPSTLRHRMKQLGIRKPSVG
jgi:formate hydrogenlyase transcriptional activator